MEGQAESKVTGRFRWAPSPPDSVLTRERENERTDMELNTFNEFCTPGNMIPITSNSAHRQSRKDLSCTCVSTSSSPQNIRITQDHLSTQASLKRRVADCEISEVLKIFETMNFRNLAPDSNWTWRKNLNMTSYTRRNLLLEELLKKDSNQGYCAIYIEIYYNTVKPIVADTYGRQVRLRWVPMTCDNC